MDPLYRDPLKGHLVLDPAVAGAPHVGARDIAQVLLCLAAVRINIEFNSADRKSAIR